MHPKLLKHMNSVKVVSASKLCLFTFHMGRKQSKRRRHITVNCNIYTICGVQDEITLDDDLYSLHPRMCCMY